MHRLAITVACLVALAVAPTSARAADPAFVGTWGKDAAQCAISQEQQGAPLVFSKGGYDQHEAHCKFKSVAGKHPKWKIKAACSVQGDTQTDAFSIAVKGNTLTMREGGGATVLKRCR